MRMRKALPGHAESARGVLLAGTSLAAVLLLGAGQAAAQPAPNARPTGGVVVAGAAAIGQTATVTTITQTSQRAAVNWRGFDVGSQQRVTFQQPSATAITLNRVTGPDASQIAGRIDANGQVALVNPSGVVFYRGAQVNAASLLVSSANISNANFMAGQMVFDQPGRPNARIDNRGTITVKEAGLAAFVAPQVANSGVINAKLGHVVLAGAKTATLDLYGDGLLALDVSGQVTQVPVGPDGQPVAALVTNTGVITAQGGTVQLTARAADGLLTNLVTAGGKISTSGGTGAGGDIVLNGVGGSLVIQGTLAARGETGGRVQALADGAVTVAGTARINASGRTRGGTVALGTTLARAAAGPSLTGAPVAATVTVAAGAVVAANATGAGNGGTITLLSSGVTTMAGALSATGGPQGGNGGFVEVSGATVGLTGQVNLAAPAGQPGTLLLDPQDLYISDVEPDLDLFSIPGRTDGVPAAPIPADAQPNAGTDAWVSPAALEATSGNVIIAATRDVFFVRSDPLTSESMAPSLSGPSLSGPSLSGPSLSGPSLSGPSLSGLSLAGTAATHAFSLSGRTHDETGGAHAWSLPATSPTGLAPAVISPAVISPAVISPTGRAPADAAVPNLLSLPGRLLQVDAGRTISVDRGFTITAGTIAMTAAGTIIFNANTGIALGNATGAAATGAAVAAATVRLSAGLGIRLGDSAVSATAPGAAGVLDLHTGAGGVAQDPAGGRVVADDLSSGGGIVGPLVLPMPENRIATIGAHGGLAVSGDIGLTTGGDLRLAGPLSAGGGIGLSAGGNLTVAGPVSAAGTGLGGGGIVLNAGGDLAIAGPVSAAGIGLASGNIGLTSGGDLTIAGPVSATGAIGLRAGGGVFAPEDITTPALTVSARSATLTGANQVRSVSFAVVQGFTFENTGDLAVAVADGANTAGSVLLSTSGALDVNGAVQATGGGLLLSAGGGIAMTGGLAGSGGPVTLLSDGPLSFAPGAFIDTRGGPLEVAPRSTGTALQAGAVAPGGVSFGVLPVLGASAEAVPPGLVRFGGYSDPATNRLVTTAGSIRLAGSWYPAGEAAPVLDLRASGAVTQTAPVTNLAAAGRLTGIAGSVALTDPGNRIARLGPFTASGGLALTSGQDLAIAGPVAATNITLRVAAAGGHLTLLPAVISEPAAGPVPAINLAAASPVPGSLTVPLGQRISLTADLIDFPTGGAGTIAPVIAAPAGLLELAPFTLGRPVVFATAAVPGSLTLDITDLRAITPATGTLRIGATSDDATPRAGAITLQQPVDLSGIAATLRLDSGGAVTQAGGAVLTAGTLAGQAGSVQLDQGNAVTALGAFTTGGGFTFTGGTGAGGAGTGGAGTGGAGTGGAGTGGAGTGGAGTGGAPLTIGGPLVAGGAVTVASQGALGVAGTITTDQLSLIAAQDLTVSTGFAVRTGLLEAGGAIAITAPLSAGTLQVLAGGSVLASGALTAGILSGRAGAGQAGGDAGFTGGNAIATLGAFAVPGGALTLNDAAPLTLAGPVQARSVDITATGALTLAGDITGLGAGGTLRVVSAGPGSAPVFAQTGAVTLAGGSGTVMTIALPDGGSMRFAGLDAAGIGLVLEAGAATLSGTMSAGSLLVQGAGGRAVLLGSVAGDTSAGAAARARIRPGLDPAYTFNGCEIGALLCSPAAALGAQTAVLGGLIDRAVPPPGLDLLAAGPGTAFASGPTLLPAGSNLLLPASLNLLPSNLPAPVALAPYVLVPLPSLTPPPHRLTDPDVLPPNISGRDY